MMRKYLAAAAAALSLISSCAKGSVTEVVPATSVEGGWRLESWTSGTGTDSAFDDSRYVYLEFCPDGSYHLYQKIDALQGPVHIEGSYSLSEGILSGEYSDRQPWAGVYRASMLGGKLRLEPESNPQEIYVYVSDKIPDSLR